MFPTYRGLLSPCGKTPVFANVPPLYGSHWPIPEGRRNLSRESRRWRFVSPARGCFRLAVVRQEAGSAERGAHAHAGDAVQDRRRGIELRRSRARIRQAVAEGTIVL